jgi:adenine phosphoribosyltransferase
VSDAVFDIKAHIAAVPDFPKPGILFRDIMPLLRSHFGATIAALGACLTEQEWSTVDTVKLPPPVVDRSYQLEYGQDRLEMQRGNGRALLLDDVLATGGTLATAGDLCLEAGYDVGFLLVLIDLRLVPDFHWSNLTPRSVAQY